MLRLFFVILAAMVAFVITGQSYAQGQAEKHLFVWVGDRAGEGNDFILVIDADPASANYGRVVASEASDQRSVNAHHTEYEMPASGMLFANDHDANRTIILDLTNPLQPRQAAAFTSLGGYSMRLIGEQYLGGRVELESSASGTVASLLLPLEA